MASASEHRGDNVGAARRRRRASGRVLFLAASLLALLSPGVVHAQEPVAGRVVPETFQPKKDAPPPAIDLGRFAGQAAPASAESVRVRPGEIRFEGDTLPLPEAGERMRRDLVRTAAQDPVTVAEIFDRAARLERELADAGYVLTRILTPPQKIEPGGAIVFRVVNGKIDELDASGLPPPVREAVLRRLRPLVGRAPLTLAEIEEALLVAGELGGLSLRSTVATGDTPGGVRLLLDGGFNRISGTVGVDRLASDRVGGWGVNGSIAVNSPFGNGEQVYLAYQGDLKTFLREDARMRVAAAGAVLPVGISGMTVGPEVVWARVRPLPAPGVPDSRNELLRATVRTNLPLSHTRNQRINAHASVETVAQKVTAIDFDTVLSADAYLAARAGIDAQFYPSASMIVLGSMSVSRGLGDVDSPFSGVEDAPSTHRGADGDFSRANLVLGMRLQGQVHSGSVALRMQSAFGGPLVNSEQLNLDGPDGLSSLCPGEFAVDQGFTVRTEIGTRRQTPYFLPGVAEPYLFVAFGGGEVFDPGPGPDNELRAAEVGVGARFRFGQLGPRNTPVSLGLEVGANWVNALENQRETRANMVLAVSF
jgi:hemolysin activation/secretion protein